MRVGLQVPNFTWPTHQGSLGETFAMVAQRAERAGFSSLWVMDHFFQISVMGPAEHEMLEGYSALAFAAGRTNRIKLGTMVTGVTYRYPGPLVKTVTTLDVLSHGRAYLGIGAPGMKRSTLVWVCRSLLPPSGLSAWRRPYRSRTRCGQETRSRIRANITSWDAR